MSETLPDRIFLNDSARRESRTMAAWLAGRSTLDAGGVSHTAQPSISAEFATTMANILSALGSGRTITVGALPDELTTTVAAEQMGVSRATLMKWVQRGDLPSHKVGTHTRVKTADVMKLRQERATQQRKALEELLALEDEFDVQ